MRQKYILERLLLKYLVSINSLSPQKIPIFDGITLPNQLKLTNEFRDCYLEIVQRIVLQKLVDIFKWRDFFFSKNETTYRCNISDSSFWKNIEFCFTQKGANVLWCSYIKKQTSVESINPWDAMLIQILAPKHKFYSEQWLLQNDAHWLVMAYFMFFQNKKFAYNKFPHAFYFQNYKKIVYPLRFILIELTATYYSKVIEIFEDVIASSSEGYWNSGYRYSLDLRDKRFWEWLENMESHLEIEAVTNAYKYWCNEGSIGYDDSDFLHKHEREWQLLKNISSLKEIKKSLGSIKIS
ncbi:hypothetical protein [Candidatus Uabimicrobium sp. HlEnr_7]|uniref:hypothetical protein n=1 Tax=Candidatus Uabimicrobium helgolandensis TaxID=3095367 RepID=UPI003558AA5C